MRRTNEARDSQRLAINSLFLFGEFVGIIWHDYFEESQFFHCSWCRWCGWYDLHAQNGAAIVHTTTMSPYFLPIG